MLSIRKVSAFLTFHILSCCTLKIAESIPLECEQPTISFDQKTKLIFFKI